MNDTYSPGKEEALDAAKRLRMQRLAFKQQQLQKETAQENRREMQVSLSR